MLPAMSAGANPTAQFEINPDALQFIYEATKDVPHRQRQRGEAVDSKAVQVFSAATILLGLMGVGVADAIAGRELALYAGALVAYVAAAISAFWAFRPRTWRANDHAQWLWEHCYFRTPTDVMHILTNEMRGVAEHNESIVNSKVRGVEAALVFTAIEGMLVAGALLVSHV